MTRKGKIARLPLEVRNELNRRLQDGETGVRLIEWLNSREDVRKVLDEEFGGRPINEPNLSDWNAGGYQDWLRLEESRAVLEDLAEESAELDETVEGRDIGERFAGLMAVELSRLSRLLLEKETNPEKRWLRLCEILGQVSRLRLDNHRAERTVMKREWLDRLIQREETKTEEHLEELSRQNRKRVRFAELLHSQFALVRRKRSPNQPPTPRRPRPKN